MSQQGDSDEDSTLVRLGAATQLGRFCVSPDKHDLAFLHTSSVHIKTFEDLLQELAPGLAAYHHVDESLLKDVQSQGGADEGLRARITAAMQVAAATGSRMVVCTCSSIGEVAEHMNGQSGFATARIDRAMADRAAALGPRILLVAALDSTLLPTAELLQESAKATYKSIEISTLLVDGAWAHFLNGDRIAYLNTIVDAIRQYVQTNAAAIDVLVLAQASMAAAAEELRDIGKPVLSSPKIGLQAAIDWLQQSGS